MATIIPKSFKLGGLEIKVNIDNEMVHRKKVIGECRYSEQSITMDITAGHEELTEQSFYHELIHWILYMMSRDELRNDEGFVDLFAHFLYQYEKTKEFDVAPKKEKDSRNNP